MAVNIIWSSDFNGFQISDDIVFEETPGSGIAPLEVSASNQVYLRHTGGAKITECGFYTKSYGLSYSGGATKEEDISEILEWGNDVDTIYHVYVDDVSHFASDAWHDTHGYSYIKGNTSGAIAKIHHTEYKDIVDGNPLLSTDGYVYVREIAGTFQVSEALVALDADQIEIGSTITVHANVSALPVLSTHGNVLHGLYVNLNYLDSFADYTILNVDDSSTFVEGLIVTGTNSGASATVVKVETNKLIVSKVVGGPFDEIEPITDTDVGAANTTSTGTESSWIRFRNLYGNDKTNAIPVTVDSVVGSLEVGQLNGEIYPDQSVSAQFKIYIPSNFSYTDMQSYKRQIFGSITYKATI